MKIKIIPAQSRGSAEHGWLSSRFSFSFADYYDPERIHFGALRVLNDDIINAGMGFGMHPHNNMEIVTIPLSGALEHRDSLGNGSIIKAGEIQYMSAGSGIRHSEFNPLKEGVSTLLQIWIFPNIKNTAPEYAQKAFDTNEMYNKLRVIVSPNGVNESIVIKQDAWISQGFFDVEIAHTYFLNLFENGVYVFVIEGCIAIEDQVLCKRDAACITETGRVHIKAIEKAHVLFLEVPMHYKSKDAS